MKLHLPIALLAAVVCVMSTPVAQARLYYNTLDYLRTDENPNGIFEQNYNAETGAVDIVLHEGTVSTKKQIAAKQFEEGDFDFEAMDVWISCASDKKYYYDEGFVIGAAPLSPDHDCVSYYAKDNKPVKSVTISVEGGTGIATIAGVGVSSCVFEGVKDADSVQITMNSGSVGKIIGGVFYSNGLSPEGTGKENTIEKIYNNVSITVNGGTVGSIAGGHSGKQYDIIHIIFVNRGLGTTLPGTNMIDGINDMEEYNAIRAKENFWSFGGNINIEVTGGDIGNIKGAGGAAHSVDGDVNVSISGGTIKESVVVGPTGAFAELAGNAVLEITGDAKVQGNVYGSFYDTEGTSGEDKERGLPAPVIKGNSTMHIGGNAVVEGDVCAVGDGGRVEGNTEVYLQDNAVVKRMVSGIGINGAALNEKSTSTLYVGTSSKAYTGSVGSIDGFSHVVVNKGSSLKMSAGNVFAIKNQTITLSSANLNTAALIGDSAVVGDDGLALTLLSDGSLGSGKYKVVEIVDGKTRATSNGPEGWTADNVSVDGIATYHDMDWDGSTLYLTLKEAHIDAAVVSNWGIFKSSQAFTGTLWGNRSNAVVLGASAPAAGVQDGKLPVCSAEPTSSNAQTLAWGTVYGQSGRISGDGADYSLYGAAIGTERQFGRMGSSIGVSFGYDWGKVSPFTTTSVDQETWHAALYGRVGAWKAGKGVVSVDWSAAYGDSTSEHDDVAGDWSQGSWQFDLRASYAQALTQRTTGSVFAGAQYYTNDDASVGAMQISSMQNLRLMAGGGLSYAATTRTNVYAQASIYSDAMRHNPSVDINGACFKGTNPGRVGGVISVGADYDITDKWTLRGGYSFDAAEDSVEHNVNAGVQFKF